MIAGWVGDNNLACDQLVNASRYSDLSAVWSVEAAAVLGPAARRSVLRKNRRLPGAKVILW